MNTLGDKDQGNYLQWQDASGGSIEIHDVLVRSEYRRQGIGRYLVDQLVKECERLGVTRIWAITRAENRMAQEWYEALNFRSIPLYDFYGTRTEKGDRTVDAIMYIRDLEQYP